MSKPSTPFSVKKPASVTSAKVEDSADNFGAERTVGMTFNMPEGWHREFKVMAAVEGMSMRDLLIKCFDHYKASKA